MDPMRTQSPLGATLVADYDLGNLRLGDLYEKAKAAQWNAARDIDWSVALDPANPLDMPDETSHLHGTPVWRRMGEADRARLRHHLQAWKVSQILHGEQAAMLCAAKIAQSSDRLDVKINAATQVGDEARHVEVYGRLLRDQFEATYPVSPLLGDLLRDVLSDPRDDVTCLGMQILVEGIALSIFRRILGYSQVPMVRGMLNLVLRDEARHYAFGRLALKQWGESYTEAERAEREEFVCEAAHRLYRYLLAEEVWEAMGMSRAEIAECVEASAVMRHVQAGLFRQLVPAVREIGLLGGRATALFDELGVLEFADFPLADFDR